MDIGTSQKFKDSGVVFFNAGQFDLAINQLVMSLEADPNDIRVLSLLAESYVAKQKRDIAINYYTKALDVDPVNTSILLKLSGLKLDGPNYIDVLKSAHNHRNPERYIEIGVCKGVSFGLANEQTLALGIDPEPQLKINSLPQGHTVVRDTSDSYFESGRIDKDFNGKPFDMAFLDGMHLFEFALRDFINLEKYSNSDSVIFIHDLYPMNAATSTRERNSDFWSGDVWKLVLCLSEYRPDLDLKVLPCPPTGLGFVRNLDRRSSTLEDNYDTILNKYVNMLYDSIKENKEQKLKLVADKNLDLLWQ